MVFAVDDLVNVVVNAVVLFDVVEEGILFVTNVEACALEEVVNFVVNKVVGADVVTFVNSSDV